MPRRLTVAENISLGRMPNRRGLVSWGAVHDRSERQFIAQLEVDIDPEGHRRHTPGG